MEFQTAIEAEFRDSWEGVRGFFERLVEDYPSMQLAPMLLLIDKFRHANLDTRFRAGQSLHFLVISRAKKYGLGLTDPAISFDSYGENRFQLRFHDCQELIEYDFDLSQFDPVANESIQALLAYQLH